MFIPLILDCLYQGFPASQPPPTPRQIESTPSPAQDQPNPSPAELPLKTKSKNFGMFQRCIKWQKSWKMGEKMGKTQFSIEIFVWKFKLFLKIVNFSLIFNIFENFRV